jgi:hypothetical protein
MGLEISLVSIGTMILSYLFASGCCCPGAGGFGLYTTLLPTDICEHTISCGPGATLASMRPVPVLESALVANLTPH